MKNTNTNLENKNGTVTNLLVKYWNKITTLFSDMTVSTEDFKSAVSDVISEANSTPGQKRILSNVQRQKSKLKVMEFVTNTMLAGSGEAVYNPRNK